MNIHLAICSATLLAIFGGAAFLPTVTYAQQTIVGDPEAVESKLETSPFSLAEEQISVAMPQAWRQVKPRNRIIEAEFAIEPDDQEEAAESPTARLTIMAAGGSVEANLTRWIGQFRDLPPDTEPQVERESIADMKLTLLDISGTFFDRPKGPRFPPIEKPEQRMLAAILQTGDRGNYFFKLVGPIDLIEQNAERFRAMVTSAQKQTGEPGS